MASESVSAHAEAKASAQKGRSKLKELKRIEAEVQKCWRTERYFESDAPATMPQSKSASVVPC